MFNSKLFVETRDAELLQPTIESFRKTFENFTCQQYGWAGTDEFIERLTARLRSEPYDGTDAEQWMWRVFWDMAAKRPGMSSATEIVLRDALAAREAILAIDVGYEYDESERWIADDCRLRLWFDERCRAGGMAGELLAATRGQIDFNLIADKLAA